MDEKLTKYSLTDKFKVIDTIGVPHPYCITEKHLQYNDSMYLGKEQIERMERNKKVKCGMRNCKLTFDEHKQALLIEVKDTRELKNIPELKDYLLSIKEMTESDGFEGWAFKQVKGE